MHSPSPSAMAIQHAKSRTVDVDEINKEQHPESPIASNASGTLGNKIPHECAVCDGSSFIRVIVIRRILVNDMNMVHGNIDGMEYIKHLMAEMTDLDDSIKSKIYKTLSVIIKNNGIKTYFDSWKEKDNNPHTINIIFNKLILKQFVNQYHNIMTYKSKSDDDENEHWYQDTVFNTVDLMCSIFKFLEYDDMMKGDLLNCSLVCSHWLYHVYNTCIPFCDISFVFMRLLRNTLCYDHDTDSSVLRMWQRLTKLKSVFLSFGTRNYEASQYQLLLNKLSSVKNVTHLEGECRLKHVPTFKKIVKQWQETIENYSWKVDFMINSNDHELEKNVTSPIMLPNVKYMSIFHLYFYVIWTNRCEKLGLLCMHDLDKQWCDFVIENCDCSNIKSLHLSEARYQYIGRENDFINRDNGNHEEEKQSLKGFVQQFINLKNFIITFYKRCDKLLLYLFIYLTPIITKNNVNIELDFYDVGFLEAEFNKVLKFIQEQNIGNKIRKIDFDFDDTFTKEKIHSAFEAIKQVCICSIEWISIRAWESCSNRLIVSDMNKMSFQSLQVLEYYHHHSKSGMESLCNILKMDFNKLSKCKLYIIADFEADFPDDDGGFLFATFCQQVFDLMTKYEIAIFIVLSSLSIPTKSKYDEYYNIYLAYFNENRILKNYKQPQGNKYCVPLEKPQITFTWYNVAKWVKMAKMVFKNARKSDNFNYQYSLSAH